MKKLKCRVVAKPQQKGKEMDKLCIVCKSEKEESKVLEELEKQGKIFVFRPSQEMDIGKIMWSVLNLLNMK